MIGKRINPGNSVGLFHHLSVRTNHLFVRKLQSVAKVGRLVGHKLYERMNVQLSFELRIAQKEIQQNKG